jgi:hypothetical protein
MHIIHNLRNPRCTACTKCRARQSDKPLKSCPINHLLWNHGSSLTFVKDTLADHFPWRMINAVYMIAMIGVDQLCTRRKPIGATGLVSGRYVHEIVHGHAHVQTDQVNFCACTHAQNRFAETPK